MSGRGSERGMRATPVPLPPKADGTERGPSEHIGAPAQDSRKGPRARLLEEDRPCESGPPEHVRQCLRRSGLVSHNPRDLTTKTRTLSYSRGNYAWRENAFRVPWIVPSNTPSNRSRLVRPKVCANGMMISRAVPVSLAD